MSEVESKETPAFYGIEEMEAEIAKSLSLKVPDYLALLADAYALSGTALLAAYPDTKVPLDKMVATKLLMLLNNDVRAVHLLAEVGYNSQANSIAASVYEASFTIATISGDASLADAWLKHEDPTKPFRNAKSLTASGLAKYGADANWIVPLYQIYRQFCWGKHLNPIAEQQGGMERSNDGLDYIPGPNDDELTERGICFSSIHSTLCTLIAVEVFARYYVLTQHRSTLLQRLKAISDQRQLLHEGALARWNSVDPFPGKW